MRLDGTARPLAIMQASRLQSHCRAAVLTNVYFTNVRRRAVLMRRCIALNSRREARLTTKLTNIMLNFYFFFKKIDFNYIAFQSFIRIYHDTDRAKFHTSIDFVVFSSCISFFMLIDRIKRALCFVFPVEIDEETEAGDVIEQLANVLKTRDTALRLLAVQVRCVSTCP